MGNKNSSVTFTNNKSVKQENDQFSEETNEIYDEKENARRNCCNLIHNKLLPNTFLLSADQETPEEEKNNNNISCLIEMDLCRNLLFTFKRYFLRQLNLLLEET